MLKKPITYTDFNNETVTEDFYFNLTSAELARLELGKLNLSTGGGMKKYLEDAISSGEGQRILDAFELFIDASYGVRSPDGKKFYKADQYLTDFRASGAYDALFMQMVTDAESGAAFVNGIMPADLIAQAEAIKAQEAGEMKGQSPTLAIVDEVTDVKPSSGKKQPRSKQELLAAFREKNAPKEPDWLNMTEAEAMQLPQEQFYKWLNAQPEATQA